MVFYLIIRIQLYRVECTKKFCMKKLLMGLMAMVFCLSSFGHRGELISGLSVQSVISFQTTSKIEELSRDEDFIQFCKNSMEITKIIGTDLANNLSKSKISGEEFLNRVSNAIKKEDSKSIIDAYEVFGVSNVEKIVELQAQQIKIIQNLTSKYSELKSFSQKEVESLFLDNYDKVLLNVAYPTETPTAEATCDQKYGSAKNRCDARSDRKMIIAGAATFFACFGGPVSGAAAYAIGVATVVNNWNNCMEDAHIAYLDCLGK